MGEFIDITGERFGRLVVVGQAGYSHSRHLLWECHCDCGNEIITRGQDLRRGASQSCGCLKIEQLNARSRKHDMTGSRPYRIWKGMKTRCYNKRVKSYADYGERGIRICDRWLNDFSAFWEDMREGYADNLEIDRIDSDGNYCPGNCRWATKTQQNRNTRANSFVETSLGKMCIAELAEKAGLPYDLVKSRVHRGWSADELLKPAKDGTRCSIMTEKLLSQRAAAASR